MNSLTAKHTGSTTNSLNNIHISTDFTDALPGDVNPPAHPHSIENILWSSVTPAKTSNPKLIAWSKEMADTLSLDIAGEPEASAQLFTGNTLANGSAPYAMRYGGHQFGSWAGQLGDGRAIALGEVSDVEGQHWTLQLKGAGPTPYSRQGDGLAVLRSSVREFLCSEAMHHLGVPTTRSLSLCLTGDSVARDVFYDGNVQHEPGAILCRAAHSFVRFGSFEIHAAHRETEQLKALADHVITRDYEHLGKPSTDVYQQWFREVLQRTARLMADWQRVGFVHAVMNTDNMSILGQTIDYGPYGWLEEYDPQWTPNFVDLQGRRYSYGNQPQIGLWNLYKLANAILPLFDNETAPLVEVLDTYNDYYDQHWKGILGAKLGISNLEKTDTELFTSLWSTLELSDTDFTIFFRKLADIPAHTEITEEAMFNIVSPAFYSRDNLTTDARDAFGRWLSKWSTRVSSIDPNERRQLMNTTNPKYVLRNYIALLAIDAAEAEDYRVIDEVLDVLRKPYDEQPQHEKYAAPRPDWATKRAGCTMLTCSS